MKVHGGDSVQKITPFLRFDHAAEEAAAFYVSALGNSRIIGTTRYGEGARRPKGIVMAVSFALAGQDFTALDGGPVFSFSPTVSLVVSCESQEEIDRVWEQLSAGGTQQECGWVQDEYAVSRQMLPRALPELLSRADEQQAQRVTDALLRMKKLEIEPLVRSSGG